MLLRSTYLSKVEKEAALEDAKKFIKNQTMVICKHALRAAKVCSDLFTYFKYQFTLFAFALLIKVLSRAFS